MTFRQNHELQLFNDLIFRDPAVEQVLRGYVSFAVCDHADGVG
ncbi:MAG: hypothetical protein ACJATG_002204 [Dinoroseobacter sp.]|jgi:hypothetical protein